MNEVYRFRSEQLEDFLRQEKMTLQRFADQIKVSRSLVEKMLYQQHCPGMGTLLRIVSLMGKRSFEELVLPRRRSA